MLNETANPIAQGLHAFKAEVRSTAAPLPARKTAPRRKRCFFVEEDDRQGVYDLNKPPYLFKSSTKPHQGFVLLSSLGTGAFGEVYLGNLWAFTPGQGWTSDCQRVAIKLMRVDYMSMRRFDLEYNSALEAFKREAEFLLAMQGGDGERPLVPRTLESGFGTVDLSSEVYAASGTPYKGREQPFIVMEFLDGGDLLNQVCKYGKVYDELEAFNILNDIIACLLKLHEVGLCHRDLKAGNIAIDSDGRARLLDLGLACEIAAAPYRSAVGTSGWMAPEVVAFYCIMPSNLADDELRPELGFDQSVDVYGVGAILQWILLGYWDPEVSAMRYASAYVGRTQWFSPPVLRIIDATMCPPGVRVSLKGLAPMMAKWRRYIARAGSVNFDNAYTISPPGRDCRRFPYPEDAFARFKSTLEASRAFDFDLAGLLDNGLSVSSVHCSTPATPDQNGGQLGSSCQAVMNAKYAMSTASEHLPSAKLDQG